MSNIKQFPPRPTRKPDDYCEYQPDNRHYRQCQEDPLAVCRGIINAVGIITITGLLVLAIYGIIRWMLRLAGGP